MEKKLPFRLVQIATVAVFLGRAWQHLYWDAPYRALLWDEAWMKWAVENLLGLSWRSYVTSPATDSFIQSFITTTGWFYVLCALVAVLVSRLGRLGRALLYIGAANLAFLASLYLKEKFFFTGQFFEYTLQWGTPALLAYLSANPLQRWNPRLVLAVKFAIALTFSCHGLYAVGFYPRPGNFTYMVMSILSVQNEAAIAFLNVAGTLDFVLSLALFLPGRWPFYALGYAVFWGLATSVARVWAYFYWEMWASSLKQWLHEAAMRFPHFLIPLALLVALSIIRESSSNGRKMAVKR